MGIVIVPVRDWNQHNLLGREPGRESPAIMLDQHAKEAFHRTQQSPVDHVGAVFLAVLAYVGQVEPLRLIEIELNG